MYQLRDQTIDSTRIVLKNDEVNYLGPNLVLRRCQIVIRTAARGLVVTRVSFVDCEIETKKPLRNFSFCNARLEGCRIAGMYVGCDFGRWPDDDDYADAGVVGCDFSAARLDGCRFIGCNVDTLKFPLWPCFTVLDPVGRSTELERLDWPGRIRIAFETHRDSPPETRAVAYCAPELTRRLGGEEEELKRIVTKLDGVIV